MLQFVCHPAIQNLLTTSEEGNDCVTSTNNAVCISDYIPTATPSIHTGLSEAVKFRLFNPSHLIFFASFFPKEMLLPFDTFGILTLAGTEFIRLPFCANQLLFSIKEKQTNGINLSQSDWETFALRAGKALLKEKLSVLKHGGKLDFVNDVTLTLRIEAQNCLKDSSRISELEKLLADVKSYNKNKEISELIIMSEKCQGLADHYFQNVFEFTNRLIQLESLESRKQIDFKLLISDIDKINTISSKILGS